MGQRQKHIRTTIAIILICAACIAGICALMAFCFAIARCDPVNAIGLIATILSIALAVISIYYTYRTNRETGDLLKSIESKYDSLVGKINADLRNENYNDANIANLEEKFTDHWSANTGK